MDNQNQTEQNRTSVPENQPAPVPLVPAPEITTPAATPPSQPANPHGKNWKKLILIGLVLVILIIGGGTFVLSQQETNTPETKIIAQPTAGQPTTIPDPTADWKTYINEKYQYSLKYPPQWEIQNEKSLQSENIYFYTKSAQNPNYNAYFFITVDQNVKNFTPNKEWYMEWANQIPAGISIDKIKFEGTVFHGYPALKVDSDELFFAKGNSVFRIALAVPNGDEEYKEGVKSVFDQILQTFKFTEQQVDLTLTEKEIRRDLGYDDSEALQVAVNKVIGDYAAIGVTASNGNGGGRQYLKKINGKWASLWSGQLTPKCSEMIKLQIPKDIYEDCQ